MNFSVKKVLIGFIMAGCLLSELALANEGHDIIGEIARVCGDIRVLKRFELDGKKNAYVILDIDPAKTPITSEQKTLNLSRSTTISGIVEILNTELGSNYCTDGLSASIKTLNSVKIDGGIVKIKKTKDEVSLKQFGGHVPYRVIIILEDAVFKINGKTYSIKKMEFNNVLVSFLMG